MTKKFLLFLVTVILVAGLFFMPAASLAQTAPTPGASESCLAQLEEIQAPMAFTSIVNTMDSGAADMPDLIYAQNGLGDKFVAIVEAGNKLSFEAPLISGLQILARADITLIVCAGDELAQSKSGAYRLYVGAADSPAGWSKDFPPGWKMQTFSYDKGIERVENPYPWPQWINPAYALEAGHTIDATPGWTNAQLWDGVKGGSNPGDGAFPYHLILEPGCILSIPDKFEGTSWGVPGGWTRDGTLLVPFFVQMNSDQAKNYGSTPVNLYVGSSLTPPSGYSKELPSGWTAQCTGAPKPPALPTQAAPVPTQASQQPPALPIQPTQTPWVVEKIITATQLPPTPMIAAATETPAAPAGGGPTTTGGFSPWWLVAALAAVLAAGVVLLVWIWLSQRARPVSAAPTPVAPEPASPEPPEPASPWR